jgi:hypothetical protein
MSSRDFIERLEKHGHGITDAIKSARRSDPELAENLDREWSGFLQAMSDCLEDMRGVLEH